MERMRERKQERIPKNSLQSSTEKNKERERERERERPVIRQKGGGESFDYQCQVVVRDRITDHHTSTYRRTWSKLGFPSRWLAIDTKDSVMSHRTLRASPSTQLQQEEKKNWLIIQKKPNKFTKIKSENGRAHKPVKEIERSIARTCVRVEGSWHDY